MRILFLAHRTPYPPNKGEKIRAFNLLSHLAKSHEVTLIYWVDAVGDLAHTPFLRSLCRGPVIPVQLNRTLALAGAARSLVQGGSLTQGFYGGKGYQKAVDDALRRGRFDAVLAFSSSVASYAEAIDCDIKIVDFVDVDSDKWGQLAKVSAFPLSFLYKLEQKRLAKFETQISTWSTVNMFISPAEAELYRQQGGQGEIAVLPMCTELEVRRLPLDQVPYQGAAPGTVEPSNEARLIFVGTLNYYPNIDAVIYFTEQIFPLIRQKFPRASFEIVGRNPPKTVTALGKIDGVRVLGEVPDVRSYLVRADVSVAPLRIARGVQSKVLEAMGMGVPVVATPSAIQGIDVANGQELLIGQTAEEFAACVIRLLNDAELRKTITRKAWNRMKQLYNPEVIGAHLERILSAAQKGKPQEANSLIASDHEVSAQGR